LQVPAEPLREGCKKIVGQVGALGLPEFPAFPPDSMQWLMPPPIPRLLPEWETQAQWQAPMLWAPAAAAGAGVGFVVGSVLLAGTRWRRRNTAARLAFRVSPLATPTKCS
jgi:hypothetical protein|tara:strand:- start:257 stop:586 length:330 start_codon:yes stop_codon:yes gene_type:complete